MSIEDNNAKTVAMLEIEEKHNDRTIKFFYSNCQDYDYKGSLLKGTKEYLVKKGIKILVKHIGEKSSYQNGNLMEILEMRF